MNSIMAIHPYKHQGVWVFDDESVSLVKEALIAGIPEILGRLCKEQNIHDPENGFTVLFSDGPFPEHHLKTTWIREGDNGFGDWYSAFDGEMEGWLCPALLKYYDEPPKRLYIQVKSRTGEKP